jgi:phage shock protein C
MASKKLYRSTTDRKIFGVCGGLGDYFNIDSTLVRLAWIIISVLTGVVPGILGYIVAAMVIPPRP